MRKRVFVLIAVLLLPHLAEAALTDAQKARMRSQRRRKNLIRKICNDPKRLESFEGQTRIAVEATLGVPSNVATGAKEGSTVATYGGYVPNLVIEFSDQQTAVRAHCPKTENP